MATARKPPRNLDAGPALPDPCDRCGVRRAKHPPKCSPDAVEAHQRSREAWSPAMAASAQREAEERAAKPTPASMDKWERIRAEAAKLAPGPFGRFLWLDARCTERGLPRTSAWWLYWLERYFASGKRWGYWMVGRGGAKSTTWERVSSSLAVLQERVIPPGQAWEFMFISVGVEDASRRIRGLRATNELGFGFSEKDRSAAELEPGEQRIVYSPRAQIALLDADRNEIKLASVAGTIGNLSGPNCIGLVIDEAAKLRDKAVNANPLREIVASATATFRARPGIYAVVCSSAWERAGVHFDTIEDACKNGENEMVFVARIGEPFLADALEGLEAVAAWEERGDAQRQPNPEAARAIRAHARTLTPLSPNVPTWIANPDLYGRDPGERAIATRREVEALPKEMFDGLPRHMVWLREIASLPLAVGEGPDMTEQCILAQAISDRLASRFGGKPAVEPGGVMKLPGARIGDARYAGPDPRRSGLGGPGWRRTFKI